MQSTAIAALICQGKLPKPDLAVIADTGREFSLVWDYLSETVVPALRDVGVELHIAPHSLATVDLWSGAEGNTLLIPAFTTHSGESGKLPKYCSQEWKTRVVQRFCRQHGIDDADQWIGFTIDEMDRMRTYHPGKAWQHVYPLVDLRMNRGDCLGLVSRMGWPEPPRSSCFMCPFKTDQEWEYMKNASPKDFSLAVELEREVRQRDKTVYFHKSCQPLDSVNFDTEPDLFGKSCNAGGCFT